MNELSIEDLRKLSREGNIKWTKHVVKRLQERLIYKEDVYNVIYHGKIIEQYPDSFPEPSCLISGKDLKNNPLHVVVGADGLILTVITAYEPTLDKFENDFETRKENTK